MSKHSEAAIYTHAGLPRSLRSIRMPEAYRQYEVHRQEDRISRRDAVVGRTAGRPPVNNEQSQKVSEQ